MTDVTTIHQPVLLRECVDLVAPALAKPGAVAVDCTLGLAGHSTAFLKASPEARLIGIDRDVEALALATRRMEQEGLAEHFIPVHAAFDEFAHVLEDRNIDVVDAVFMDLGLSSLQIDETERGFSYSHDAPLDMRMDVTQPLTARQVLSEYSFADLVRIFRTYGEERFSKQIAREIVRRRETEPLTTFGAAQSACRRSGAAGPSTCRQSSQARVPSVAYRSQRRAGQTRRHPAADRQPSCGRRPLGGGVVPLVGGQDGENLHGPRA